MMAARTVLHIDDTTAEQGYVERRPEYVAAVELGGVRTFMAVPMLKEDEPIGAFLLARQEVRPFTDKQIALVTSFARQAVIAIENTRLLSELRQRTNDLSQSLEQQTATSDVLQVISSSPGELEPVFETMLFQRCPDQRREVWQPVACARAISFILERQLAAHRPRTSIICAASVCSAPAIPEWDSVNSSERNKPTRWPTSRSRRRMVTSCVWRRSNWQLPEL